MTISTKQWTLFAPLVSDGGRAISWIDALQVQLSDVLSLGGAKPSVRYTVTSQGNGKRNCTVTIPSVDVADPGCRTYTTPADLFISHNAAENAAAQLVLEAEFPDVVEVLERIAEQKSSSAAQLSKRELEFSFDPNSPVSAARQLTKHLQRYLKRDVAVDDCFYQTETSADGQQTMASVTLKPLGRTKYAGRFCRIPQEARQSAAAAALEALWETHFRQAGQWESSGRS